MALSRTLACQNCRQWLLKSFISTFAIPQSTVSQRRNFSTPARRWNEARERIQVAGKEDFALNDINEETKAPQQEELALETAETSPEAEAEHIPWYLRATTSPLQSTAPDALSARQRIPDLPSNPPPLLAPLLQQISVDLGIDDLTLLDLRSLDPPPALGANLLMLIGTARSEKHLHVSADKLCRWLRSEHYLSPYADGLLGRQELKLKLRRKAKRSKLMSAVGGKGGGDAEDLAEGIRTGWVCVNVGAVPGAEGEDLSGGEVVVESEGEFVGFGPGGSTGVRIVVQMLTEEKRGEVDLERLWTAVLKKSEREKEAIANQETIEEEPEEVLDVVEPAKVAAEDVLAEAEVEPVAEEAEGEQHRPARIRGLRGRQHIRAYHTSARRPQRTTETSTPWDDMMASQTPKDDPEQFYQTWRSFPALRVPRSAGLYTTLFNHIASGAFNSPSSGRPTLRDDGKILGDAKNELQGLSEPENAASASLSAVRGIAESRAILSEALCTMESEDPAVRLEDSGVELGMALLRALIAVDPEGSDRAFGVWRGRCEKVLRKAIDGSVVHSSV